VTQGNLSPSQKSLIFRLFPWEEILGLLSTQKVA